MNTTSEKQKMTSSTSSTVEINKSTNTPANAITDADNHTWYSTEFGEFRVSKSRWGTYTSYDKEGNGLVTGLTEEAVITVTPMHLEANSPGYDGKYDGSKFSSSAGVKL